MDVYHAYRLETNDDIIIAFLSEWGFESFVEDENHTIAYISESELSKYKADIEGFLREKSIGYTREEIQPQNWNALWEQSFQPVVVDNFCIVRADFHETIPNIKHDLIIQPKMAFGTGHHATTHMMIQNMQYLDFIGKIVFDYGAGTGILAILAAKMGCTRADALDIETESFQNMKENILINNVSEVVPLLGTLDAIQGENIYDIILANINRNILLQSAERLHELLKSKGCILLSGILEEDIEIVVARYESTGYTLDKITKENNWSCLQFYRTT